MVNGSLKTLIPPQLYQRVALWCSLKNKLTTYLFYWIEVVYNRTQKKSTMVSTHWKRIYPHTRTTPDKKSYTLHLVRYQRCHLSWNTKPKRNRCVFSSVGCIAQNTVFPNHSIKEFCLILLTLLILLHLTVIFSGQCNIF